MTVQLLKLLSERRLAAGFGLLAASFLGVAWMMVAEQLSSCVEGSQVKA